MMAEDRVGPNPTSRERNHLSFADGSSALGVMRLSRVKVGAELYFSGGRFINPG